MNGTVTRGRGSKNPKFLQTSYVKSSLPREVAAVVEEVKHSLLGQFAFVHVPKGEEREGEGELELGRKNTKTENQL